MDPETLNYWATVAAIFLFINALVVTIASGVIFGFAWWYLRKGRMWLGTPLLMAQVYALRAQHITTQVSDKIVGVPIAIRSTTARATTTTRLLSESVVRTVRGNETAPQLTTTTASVQPNPSGTTAVVPGLTDSS
jgi:hypothetical protein